MNSSRWAVCCLHLYFFFDMESFYCGLRHGRGLEITDCLSAPGCDFQGLKQFIGGFVRQEAESPDVVIVQAGTDDEEELTFDEKSWCFHWKVKTPVTPCAQHGIWRNSLRLAQIARILKGEKLLLMHGCLLKLADGGGVLLCGQSGMGKTTTAQRWREEGGDVAADDMVLLEYGGEVLYAHPLPTWSRCIETVPNEHFCAEEAVPLKTILALSRDEKSEEIREVEGFKYMTAIFASCMLFTFRKGRQELSEELQLRLAAIVKQGAIDIYDRFPHRTLFANLQCSLKQTFSRL